MRNPAAELADLFDAWAVPRGRSPQDHRTIVANGHGMTLTEELARAMHLFTRIEDHLEALERLNVDVTHFRDTLPRWQEAFVSWDYPWRQTLNGNANCIAPDHLRMLRALASQIDLMGAVLAPPVDRIAAALRKVDEAESFVTDAEDLNEGTRHYLLALLAEIREALVGGRPNEAAPKMAQFVGAATLVAHASPDGSPTRAKWADFARDVAVAFVGGSLVIAGQIAASGIG